MGGMKDDVLPDHLKVMYMQAQARKNRRLLEERESIAVHFMTRAEFSSPLEIVPYNTIHLQINRYHRSGFNILQGKWPGEEDWRDLEVIL